VSMFYSVNIVIHGSVMYVVIFLDIFLMVSLVSRVSLFCTGCDVMGISKSRLI